MAESIQLVGDIPEPQHFPFGMARFGLNPYGGNIFRVVFAPSVKMLVGGEFADGFLGYRTRPAYRHLGSCLILEKWISAFDHTMMNEEDYNVEFRGTNGYCITGPYPARGTYVLCEAFSGSPGDGGIEKLIGLIMKAKNNDPLANRQAIVDGQKAQEKADDDARWAKAKDSLPAFGFRAANLGGSVKATKSVSTPWRSANELGLPLRGVTQLRENTDGRI